MSFAKFFGNKLQKNKSEEVDVSHLDGKHVGIYFSAHWCPPCRGFTPKLADFYKDFTKNRDDFEIVFVSSDKDATQFDEYFETMPWCALPYSERDIKAKLSKQFKVSGIPSFIILGPDGEVVSKNARNNVMKDPKGAEFPWATKSFWEIMGNTVLSGDGKDQKEVQVSDLKENVATLVYFSAHWCGPCRGFTPKLIETYNKLKASGTKFECVFVSGDQTEEKFDEYFGEMPWCAIPFEDPRADALNEHFEVAGIPHLAVVGPDGKTICEDGRSAVDVDPEGAEFPWFEKSLKKLDQGSAYFNDHPCLCLMCDGEEVTDKDSEKMRASLFGIADKDFERQKESKEEGLKYFHGRNDSIIPRIREFTNVGEKSPMVLLMDIPEMKKYTLECKEGSKVIEESEFQEFCDNYYNKKLQSKPLKE